MLQSMKPPDRLYSNAKVALLRLIYQNIQKGVYKLPPGEELAKSHGVSLVLIRDVLGELESRGYITRRRGKGILINENVCRLGPRIDEQIDFQELIQLHGLTPSIKLIGDRWVDAENAFLPAGSHLRECGEPLLEIERIFCGSGQPLLHSLAYFRGSNFKFDHRMWKNFEELNLCEFLEIFCHQQPNTTVAELDIYAADRQTADKLGLPEGTSLLRMSDIRYALDGSEIMGGYVLFHQKLLPLKLFRRSDLL